jgi:hypothetical protein
VTVPINADLLSAKKRKGVDRRPARSGVGRSARRGNTGMPVRATARATDPTTPNHLGGRLVKLVSSASNCLHRATRRQLIRYRMSFASATLSCYTERQCSTWTNVDSCEQPHSTAFLSDHRSRAATSPEDATRTFSLPRSRVSTKSP